MTTSTEDPIATATSYVTAERVCTATFDVGGMRRGWRVTIMGDDECLTPYVVPVDYSARNAAVKTSVAHTRCQLVADALIGNPILRNAYATLATLEALYAACVEYGDTLGNRGQIAASTRMARAMYDARDLIAAIKEGR